MRPQLPLCILRAVKIFLTGGRRERRGFNFERINNMHELFQKANSLTETVIGAVIEVHKAKGPSLLESIYEWCMMIELELRFLEVTNQKTVEIHYKGHIKEELLKYDILIEQCLLVEAKSVINILPIHKAQLLSYMNLLDVPLGLIINFKETKLVNGVHRLILPGADKT